MTSETRYRPSLLLALKKGASDFYDRLGLAVAASLFLTVPTVVLFVSSQSAVDPHSPASVPLMKLGFLAGVLWIPFGLSACMLMARRMAYFEDPGPDVFADAFRPWRPIIALGLLDIAVPLVLMADAQFFLSMPSLAPRVLGIVVGYCLLLWLMSALWHWPFFCSGERRTLTVLKRSALVALDNPFYTLGVLFVTILAYVALLASIFGAMVAMGGLLSCFITRAHRELMKKYGLAEDPPDEVADPGWPASDRLRRTIKPEEPENQQNA